MLFGFLNFNKPIGASSRDVVNVVQRSLRPIKVGHAGTLDPLATGVLVVAVGPATRLIEYVQAQAKTYRAVFRLGQSSNTEDLEGEITELPEAPVLSVAQLESVLPNFVGSISQVPPAYSAIKIDGKRAYRLARKGKSVELSARKIQIHSIRLLSFDYPDFEIEIHCGAGTYVRSLGRDIARALGSEAVMVSLERSGVGRFTLDRAIALDQWDATSINKDLISPELALSDYRRIALSSSELRQLQNGRPLSRGDLVDSKADDHLLGFDEQDRLQVLLRSSPKGWRVAKSFWDAHGTPPLKQTKSPAVDKNA